MTASATLDSVELLYTDDSSLYGWYPRGIADYSDYDLLEQHFKHPTNPSIGIEKHEGPFPGKDKGFRQSWFSVVHFKDNSMHTFIKPCKPLVLEINYEVFLDACHKLPMQKAYASQLKYSAKESRDSELKLILDNLEYMHAPAEYTTEVIFK
jgi:hypothetical protein